MSTLKERALEALKAIGKYSTAREVYNYMVAKGIDVGTSKTPDASVSSLLVMYYQNGVLNYQKGAKGVGSYGFPEWDSQTDVTAEQTETPVEVPNKTGKKSEKTFEERALHQLLCNYLWEKHEYSKTIFHEHSKSKNDPTQKWVHPDIVGVSFVESKNLAAEELLKATKSNEAIKLCSYEMKIRLKNDYELKQAYFQALSNSNWANFGYLVAFDISEDNDLLEEMERLNQSFGIGIIKLGVTPSQTRILFPAKKKELDFRTIDKLCHINPDFEQFIEKVTVVLTADKKYIGDVKSGLLNICDNVLLDESEIREYCEESNIPFKE